MTQAVTPTSTPGAIGPTPARPPSRGDAIDHWLGMFTRFLRLPHEQSRAIKDELDSHMRERVRDLMLEGLSEDEGMRRAIDELGEAAELAAHFRAAHRPNRRLAMSIAAIGVAAGAAVVSIVALTHSQPPQAKPETLDQGLVSKLESTYKDEVQVEFATKVQQKDARGVPILPDVPLVGRMFVPSNAQPVVESGGRSAPQPKFDLQLTQTTLGDVAGIVAKQLGKKVMFHTNQAWTPDTKIEKIELVEADIPTAMREINSAIGLSGIDAIDYRVRADVLEIGAVKDFDKLEKSLVAYDLTNVFNCDASKDELVEAVLQFVESDGWRDNGGETATLKVVGTRMFVQAPPRYHERIAWILEQFNAHRPAAPHAASNSPFGGAPGSALPTPPASPTGAMPAAAPTPPSPFAHAVGGVGAGSPKRHPAAAAISNDPAAQPGSGYAPAGSTDPRMPMGGGVPFAPAAPTPPVAAPAAPAAPPAPPEAAPLPGTSAVR